MNTVRGELSPVITALDVPSLDEAVALAGRLPQGAPVKIGMELYYAHGPEAVRVFRDRGHEVMLDLKLHDIPETVGRAVRRIVNLDAALLTLHASGGQAMMEAAVKATEGSMLRLLAVTALTSLDQTGVDSIGIGLPLEGWVEQLATLALAAGVHGVVCSAEEAPLVRGCFGSRAPLIVTPGIRRVADATGDQRRVATPTRARKNGATHLVVGRPIRDAADPRVAHAAFTHEFGD